MKEHKILAVEEAVRLVPDGACIAASAAGLVGYPDYIVWALEERFLTTQHPAGLTVYAGCGHGVPFLHEGDARYAHPGFLKKLIAAHPKPTPDICRMIDNNEIEAYSLPQGVLQQLYRCAAAKQPGLLSKIGLGTYVDPRIEGGKLNAVTTRDICHIMELNGEDWIFYDAFPVDTAFIRGTTADEHGNLTIEHEALRLETLEIALAAKAGGGRVIAQVERVAENGTLRPKDIVVPGELVDAVVVVDDVAKHHRQTAATVYSPYFSGETRAPATDAQTAEAKPLAAEDIVCRRAAHELFRGAVVNVGVGIGAGIGAVAQAEEIDRELTFTLELGALGGTPCSMADFGVAKNPTAFLAHPSMFDFYHGGGLDITFLGAAQVDRAGNVNSSKFNGHSGGQGGFIDISQSARKVVFCTYFSAKGLQTAVDDGKLQILRDGAIPKFVETVEQITFCGSYAVAQGKEVLYVTERAVFCLTRDGLMLTEIAPGVDLEKDIFANMGFRPLVSEALKTMDPAIFSPGVMGIRAAFAAQREA